MLELMHHDYFKRPESPEEAGKIPNLKLKEEETSGWGLSAYILSCASAENIYETPEAKHGSHKNNNENSQSPIIIGKRPVQSASPQIQRHKVYMRSTSTSSLKPIRLSRIFSLSERPFSSIRSRSYSSQSSLYSMGKSITTKRRSSHVFDQYREKDYMREYESEDELRNKFPGISYHIFDEAEVLEATAESRGNHHHHHQSMEIVPSSLVEIESTTAPIPEMENLIPCESHEVTLSSSGMEIENM